MRKAFFNVLDSIFKCVGMCWCKDGFNRLPHLRVAWINATFEDLFDSIGSFKSQGMPECNRLEVCLKMSTGYKFVQFLS